MRSPLALVVLLSLSPAARAQPGPAPTAAAPAVQADWRRDGVDDRVKQALTGQGWRFEDDGRALDPKTKQPATQALLKKTILDLRQDARRAALEAVNQMLDPNRESEPTDNSRLAMIAQDLPPAMAAAVLDPKADRAKIRAMAATELDQVAVYFDGGRTLADRQAAAQPVAVGATGPRTNLPYHTAIEQSVGGKLAASAEKEIGKDPFGKTVLARLNGKNGRPDVPPILIEDQSGTSVAQYDIRRQAIVLDREGIMAAVVETVPPSQRVALRQSISTRAALLAYLDAHPEAVTMVVKNNDAVLVHELTHTWQDRREPVFRDMARGNLPDLQPLEYEEEAYKTKNLYIGSKLKNDPASVRMDQEFADYQMMTHGLGSWKQKIFGEIEDSSPSRAKKLETAQAIENARLERVRMRGVVTSDEQQAKALDLQALTRGSRELADLKAAHALRMAKIDAEIVGGQTTSYKLLGTYYLAQALTTARAPDRWTFLDQAERYAKASGDKALIEEIRKAKEKKQ